jgi:hypothetical protein
MSADQLSTTSDASRSPRRKHVGDNAAGGALATRCRSCLDQPLATVLSLGPLPFGEERAPLDLGVCLACTLAQTVRAADPEDVSPALQPSGFAATRVQQLSASAQHLIRSRRLGPDSVVVEAVTDSGSMLPAFIDAGIPALGIGTGDKGPTARHGIPRMQANLDAELARMLREAFGIQAEVFLANDMLTHVADLNGFVAGIRALLRPDGVAIIEVPYVLELIEKRRLDAIDHSSLNYFSLTALDRLFARNGLFVNDVERVRFDGDALRITVEHHDDRRVRVAQVLATERDRGLDDLSFYHEFARAVSEIKDRLLALVRRLRDDGSRVAAYGSAARAGTVCSYVGLDRELLEYVVDAEGPRGGAFLPGSRLPIVGAERLADDPPDYLLILASGLTEEIVRKERAFRERGGRFILAFPEVDIVP